MQFPHQPSMQVYTLIPLLTYRPDAPMHNRLPVWLLQTFKACLLYQYGNINPCYHCKYIVLIIIMLQQREGTSAPLPSLMIPFKIPLLFPLSPFLSNAYSIPMPILYLPRQTPLDFPLLPQ